MGKILVYATNHITFERIKKNLVGHVEEELVFIDQDHNKKTRLLPHLKQCNLALVDFDSELDDAVLFVQTIRQTSATSKIPILGMSSVSEVAFLKRIMDEGCSDFILKPFEEVNLVMRVQKGLNNQIVVDPSGYLKNNSQKSVMLQEEQLPIVVPLEWHSDFEIGVPEVDDDHKRILEHYKQLYLSMREGKGLGDYEAHVNFLMAYVTEHFEREERIQESSQYPGFEQHKKLHLAFTQRVARLMQDFQGKEVTHRDLIQLNLFIKEWLLRHILVEDRKLGHHMRQQ